MLKRIINGLEVEGTEKEWEDFDAFVEKKKKANDGTDYFLSGIQFSGMPEYKYIFNTPRASG
jgi:hypothetical protein